MVRVKDNGSIRGLVGSVKERAEILNDDGTILGYFEPVNSEEDLAYQKAALLFDPEEIQESLSSAGPWRTTAEVLERLNAVKES
jgi:hypothetical protein